MTSRTLKQRIEHTKKMKEREKEQGYRGYLKYRYKMRIDDKERMFIEQKGRCSNIGCQSKLEGRISKIAIDHCHKTEKVRGLLCINCNLALGHVKDDKNRLIGLLIYLGEIKLSIE